MAKIEKADVGPAYCAERRQDAIRSQLTVSTLGAGWFSVASRSGGDQYHIMPSVIDGELRFLCTCPSGKARYMAQLPCVHAGAVSLMAEHAGFVVWTRNDVAVLSAEPQAYEYVVGGEEVDPRGAF